MADRALKAAVATFKSEATYIPADSQIPAYPLNGVFDRAFEAVDPETGAGIGSTHPSFGVRLSDMVVPPAKGDRIVIRSVNYKVVDSEEDGQGGAHLTLKKLG